METKFTKGEWFKEESIVKCLDEKGIMTDIFTGEFGYEKHISDEEAEANAKLIAAAPEMFEALKELYDFAYMWSNDKEDETLLKALNAIKKATE